MRQVRAVTVLFIVLSVCLMSHAVHGESADALLAEDADLAELLEDLPPMDLSRATADEIARLPMLSEERAIAIIAVRDSVGTDRFTLDSIPALNGLERFILTEAADLADRERAHGGFAGSVRTGYRYRPPGESPDHGRYYIRGQFERGTRISAVVLGERDAAEPRAFDAYSASIRVRISQNRGLLVLGDYRPSFGQRLVFSRYSRTYVSGGSAYASVPGRIVNTSFEESRFLRGAFLRMSTGMVSADVWISQRDLDATLDTDGQAVTIRETGLHPGGTARDNLTERLAGLTLTLSDADRWRIGVLGSAVRYDPALARADGEGNLHDPEGSGFRYVSVAGEYRLSDTRWYAEHAREDAGEYASTGGVELHGDGFQGVIALRDASEGYWAYRAAGITSFGSTGNEQGVYMGFDGRFIGTSRLSAAYDIARTKTRTATVPLSRSRRRLQAQVTVPFRAQWDAAATLRMVDDLDTGDTRNTHRITVERAFGANRSLVLAAVHTAAAGSDGGYAEAGLKSGSGGIRGTVTLAVFDIDSYAARYYRYEQDVPGSGMIRPVWGRGFSLILSMRRDVCSLRYRLIGSKDSKPAHELAVQTDIRW